jgi:predicted transcriptional regulator
MIPEQVGPATLPPHTVVDVMNHRPVTVRGTNDLAQAVELMTAIAVKSLPVIDEHHHVVGVVSRSDIVRVLARRDETLEQEVDALFADVGVDWLAEVNDGVVTVTGPVAPRDRALAETVAATVPGVVAVIVADEPATGVSPAR